MKRSLEHRIKAKLKSEGADFVEFVNISQLNAKQTKGYPTAILLGMYLTPKYLHEVSEMPDYVEKIKRDHLIDQDEFNIKEMKTDNMADDISNYLLSIGYSAYSQSENNVASTGFYDVSNKSTPLPHKTIAGMAGLGWIGKNNLLVTHHYGCAISICSVLTNAPLEVVLGNCVSSKCGDCNICKDVCNVNAIKGVTWTPGTLRDVVVDVELCNTCLKCMVICPQTQKYMNRELGL